MLSFLGIRIQSIIYGTTIDGREVQNQCFTYASGVPERLDP